jgi:hypothetical protein
MKKDKLKKLTWDKVEKSIKSFEPSQLIGLVNDLYQLSVENKNFLHARFFKEGDSFLSYKKIILNSLYLNVIDEADNFNFDRAEKAIKDYANATDHDENTADLMIYYVECGNKFTLDHGDINESFYDALIEMYEKAIKSVLEIPKEKQDSFRKRLEKIKQSANGIGWRYYDDLCYLYYKAFE